MITQTYNLNLIPGGVPVRVACSQRDAGSRTIVFKLYNGSEEFTNSGVAGRIDGTRADGTAFQAAATISDGAATWTISLDMTASAGEHKAELIITDAGGNVLGTANFVIAVEAEAKSPNEDPTEEETTLWEQMYEQTAARAALASAKAQAAAASASAASESESAAASAAAEAQGIVDNAVQSLVENADATPTNGSNNLVLSGGVYKAIQDAKTALDTTPTSGSANGITSGAVYNSLTSAKELWSTDQTSLAAQTLTMSDALSDYDALYFDFLLMPGWGSGSVCSQILLRGSDDTTTYALNGILPNQASVYLQARQVVVDWTSNTVTVSAGSSVYVQTDKTQAHGVSSDYCVPLRIVGIKIGGGVS